MCLASLCICFKSWLLKVLHRSHFFLPLPCLAHSASCLRPSPHYSVSMDYSYMPVNSLVNLCLCPSLPPPPFYFHSYTSLYYLILKNTQLDIYYLHNQKGRSCSFCFDKYILSKEKIQLIPWRGNTSSQYTSNFLAQGVWKESPGEDWRHAGALAQEAEQPSVSEGSQAWAFQPRRPGMELPEQWDGKGVRSQGQEPRQGFSSSYKVGPSHAFPCLIDTLGEMARMATLMAGCTQSSGLDRLGRSSCPRLQSALESSQWASLYLVLRTAGTGHSTPFLGQSFSCLNISSQEVLPYV